MLSDIPQYQVPTGDESLGEGPHSYSHFHLRLCGGCLFLPDGTEGP